MKFIEALKELWAFLEGKKSNLLAGCLIFVGLLAIFGIISREQAEAISTLLLGGSIFALRSAVAKSKKK